MNILSLCTGYGGLDLAVEQVLGATTIAVSEIDKDAQRVLDVRFPKADQVGDFTKQALSGIRADVITAGFPCQPISTAGEMRHVADERWLWDDIETVVGRVEPSFVVLENVASITTVGRGEALSRVVHGLAALGFDQEYGCLSAGAVGAPHRRLRWWLVARHRDAADSGGERHGPGQDGGGMGRMVRRTGAPARQRQRARQVAGHRSVEAATDADGLGDEGIRPERELEEARCDQAGTSFGPYEPAVRRWERVLGRPAPAPVDEAGLNTPFVEWMQGLPEGWVCGVGLSRTAELRLLGNGVVPQCAAAATALLLDRLQNDDSPDPEAEAAASR